MNSWHVLALAPFYWQLKSWAMRNVACLVSYMCACEMVSDQCGGHWKCVVTPGSTWAKRVPLSQNITLCILCVRIITVDIHHCDMLVHAVYTYSIIMWQCLALLSWKKMIWQNMIELNIISMLALAKNDCKIDSHYKTDEGGGGGGGGGGGYNGWSLYSLARYSYSKFVNLSRVFMSHSSVEIVRVVWRRLLVVSHCFCKRKREREKRKKERGKGEEERKGDRGREEGRESGREGGREREVARVIPKKFFQM